MISDNLYNIVVWLAWSFPDCQLFPVNQLIANHLGILEHYTFSHIELHVFVFI